MADTKPTPPAAAGKADAPGPKIHVRALVACYIDGVYYFPGDEFDVEATAFNDQAMERVSEPKK